MRYFNILAIFAVALGTWSSGQVVGHHGEFQRNAPSPLKCRIVARSVSVPQQLLKGKPAMLHVSLENPSSEAVELTGIAVNLSKSTSRLFPPHGEPDYDALVDIEKKAALELETGSDGSQHYPKQKFAIAPHQSLEFDIDVTKLKWAKLISSSTPGATLFAVVPDGMYSEYLFVNGEGALGGFEMESNRITIAVSH